MEHGTEDMDKLVNEMPDEEKPTKRDRVLVNKVKWLWNFKKIEKRTNFGTFFLSH